MRRVLDRQRLALASGRYLSNQPVGTTSIAAKAPTSKAACASAAEPAEASASA